MIIEMDYSDEEKLKRRNNSSFIFIPFNAESINKNKNKKNKYYNIICFKKMLYYIYCIILSMTLFLIFMMILFLYLTK
jgi:hypothetical protein